MKARVARLGVVATMLLASLTFAPTVFAGHTDYWQCDYNDNSSTYQMVTKFVENTPGYVAGSTQFEYATGIAYARTLYPCDDILGHGGASYVLGANMQVGNRSDGIYQIGYGYSSISGEDNRTPHFLYTPYNTSTGANWPGSMTPIVGHLYKFEIWKFPGGNVATYKITDFAGGSEQFTVSAPTTDNINFAWWGYERQNRMSQMGTASVAGGAMLHYMGYQTNKMSSLLYRTGLKYGSEQPGCVMSGVYSPGHVMCDIIDNENDSLYYLDTWTYSRDQLDSVNDGSPG